MANIEKHPKPTAEQIDEADSSQVPTCARSPHLIGQYIKNKRGTSHGRSPRNGAGAPGTIVRLESLPATPCNLEQIRERIRMLNRQLAKSGVPFRLRVI